VTEEKYRENISGLSPLITGYSGLIIIKKTIPTISDLHMSRVVNRVGLVSLSFLKETVINISYGSNNKATMKGSCTIDFIMVKFCSQKLYFTPMILLIN